MFAQNKSLDFAVCPSSLQMCGVSSPNDLSIIVQMIEHTCFRFLYYLPILMTCVACNQLLREKNKALVRRKNYLS